MVGTGKTLRNFYFSEIGSYTRHLAASRRHSSSKDTQSRIEKERLEKVKKMRQRTDNFLLFYYFHQGVTERPQSHSSIGATVKARSEAEEQGNMGRAATILKSCSSGWNRENAAQFFIFLNFGATHGPWRRQGATAATQIHNEG